MAAAISMPCERLGRAPIRIARRQNIPALDVGRNKEWEIVQTIDSITPGNVHFNEKSLRTKMMNKDGAVAAQMPNDDASLAHSNSSMTCYSCHTSWTPTCFGCHLQMTANARKPMLHNEGLLTKNTPATIFRFCATTFICLESTATVTGQRIAPARSSCAVLVSSQNANRDWLYYAQQTISAPGFSGQAFSTFVPHTVRAKKQNNAAIATSPRRTTTMPGWHSYCCKAPTS